MGNPQDIEYYDYMKSYSPYDNVKAQDYPHLLVTTGLHDSRAILGTGEVGGKITRAKNGPTSAAVMYGYGLRARW